MTAQPHGVHRNNVIAEPFGAQVPRSDGNASILLDKRQVAQLLGICTRTLERLLARGVFPVPVRVGRSVKWFVTDVEAYLAKLRKERGSC